MDDLISRQEAIGAIRQLYPDMPYLNFLNSQDNWRREYKQYIEAEDAVKNLPPAMQWIPVTERMPEWHWINPEADEDDRVWDGEKVVICGTIGHWPYSGVACAMYGPDGWSIEDDAFSIDDEPVAWMPLPEPYKEKKDG